MLLFDRVLAPRKNALFQGASHGIGFTTASDVAMLLSLGCAFGDDIRTFDQMRRIHKAIPPCCWHAGGTLKKLWPRGSLRLTDCTILPSQDSLASYSVTTVTSNFLNLQFLPQTSSKNSVEMVSSKMKLESYSFDCVSR